MAHPHHPTKKMARFVGLISRERYRSAKGKGRKCVSRLAAHTVYEGNIGGTPASPPLAVTDRTFRKQPADFMALGEGPDGGPELTPLTFLREGIASEMTLMSEKKAKDSSGKWASITSSQYPVSPFVSSRVVCHRRSKGRVQTSPFPCPRMLMFICITMRQKEGKGSKRRKPPERERS